MEFNKPFIVALRPGKNKVETTALQITLQDPPIRFMSN